MLRFIIIILYVIVFLILSIPLMLVEWIIGKFNMDLRNRSSLFIINKAFSVVRFLAGTKVIVLGMENIPTDTAVLYVGNHRSFFDIVIPYTLFTRPTGFVAKQEMTKVPLLSIWMMFVNCLFLDRKNIKKGMKTILNAIENVKSGISMVIFPEGTRNKTADSFLPFHAGSFKIAEKGGVPIIPMTMVNTADIFEDHLPKVKKTTVVIEFGKPVYIDELPAEQKKFLSNTVKGIIEETYFKLQKEYFS